MIVSLKRAETNNGWGSFGKTASFGQKRPRQWLDCTGVVRIKVSRATGYSVFGPYADLMMFGWGGVGWGGRGTKKSQMKLTNY